MHIYFWDMLYCSTIHVGFLTAVLLTFFKISKDATHPPPRTHVIVYDVYMLTVLG